MHFTVLQVVATIVAFLAQFSRIFSATKPFWGKLPAVVQVWLPPLIPFAAALQASLTGVTTWTDFAVALIVSAALLLPGAPSNRSAAPLQAAKPYVPPMPMLFLLTLVLACGLPGCSLFGPGGSVWPKIGACAPTAETLFSEVESVLTSSGGSYEDDLLALGKTEGLEFVECAVQSVVEALSARMQARAQTPGARITPDEGIGVARGKAFLAKIAEAHK
jgi:hypothetical protein